MKEAYDSERRLKITFYNRFFGSKPDLSHLEPDKHVTFAFGRSNYFNADAVIFHVPNLYSSRLGLRQFKFLYKPKGQLWVAWSRESAINYPALDNPAFLRRMDLVMSYRRTSDIWEPYCPPRAEWLKVRSEPIPEKQESAPIVMFQSASANRSGRLEYALAVMNRIRVDSFGLVLNTRQLEQADTGRGTKLATIRRYKFCLCLENALDVDYVTEKFFDPLLVGTVPVYRGAPNVERFSPGDGAFINANEFSGPEALCTYLKDLARDEQAYRRFFKWREQPLRRSFELDLEAGRRETFSRLVEIIRRRQADRIRPR
jgi:glycosyl transferase family 10 (putative fucosyltransferase)